MPRLRLAGSLRKPVATAAKNTVTYQIGMDALAASYNRKHAAKRIAEQPFKIPEFPPESMPPKGTGMAMDETPLSSVTAWAAAQAISSAWSEGLQFLGYTYLSELAQRAEYRVPSEIIAEEMTRKWIRFQGKGDADKTDKISELTDYLDDLKLKATFHQAALIDGLMGRGHIYIDTGQTKDGDELQTSIGNGRDDVSRSKVGKGKLRGFKVIEPIFAYPLSYNSSDPLADDWYRPEQWFAMSRSIHRSRFLTLVGRPVPDILKPAYAFGGLSLSQLGKPYVDNWLRTRQSVSDLVHSFTVFKLGTDMSTLLMDQGDQLFRRMELFNNLRDNNNLFLHDKETEEFDNTSAPLGTLDALLTKSQEQMCSVWRIPIVKFLGIQPGGLNPSSEGEIATFYDTILAQQERLFRPPLTTCIDFAQMSLWGDIDPDIVFVFEPLRALSRKEEAEVRKTDAETGQILVTGGAISQEEERIRIASDPDTLYQGLDPNDVPDLQEEEEEGLAIKGAGGAEKAILEGPGGESDKPKDVPDKPKKENDKEQANDAAFSEEDHPRKDDGKFGSGGGSEIPNKPETKSKKSQSRQQYEDQFYSLGYRRAKGSSKEYMEPLYKTNDELRLYEDDVELEGQEFADKEKAKREKLTEIYNQGEKDFREGKPDRTHGNPEGTTKDPTIRGDKGAANDGVVPFDGAGDSEFKESDHPRDNGGKFGSGGSSAKEVETAPATQKKATGAIANARSFLKSANLRATIRGIAGALKANQRAILAAAVVAAVTKIAGGYIAPELEEMISHEVTTFAEKTGVAVAKAREIMQAIAGKLIAARTSTAKDAAEPDDVLDALMQFHKGLGPEISNNDPTTVLSKISAALKSDKIATDPPVSEPQKKAMYAAAEGKSALGIPKEVGEEFVGKEKGE